MRIKLGGVAILFLGLGLSGCASSVGTVAGNAVGGAGWVAMKTGKLAWKGGTYAAKSTGKAVAGAARGVDQEFRNDPDSNAVNNGAPIVPARDAASGASAQDQGAALVY